MITVKQGDTHAITWTVQDATGAAVNLTGATVRVICRRFSAATSTVLASTASNPTGGVVSHTLTGLLDPGSYQIEIECTQSGVITTAPTGGYDTLVVVADLD